jgi:transposase
VVWVTKGRSKATVGAFFDALGPQRAEKLEIVTTDGASWIRTVVAARAPNAEICLDTFHVVSVRHEALCVRGWVRGPPCWSVAADR